uniref:NADH-ubiquinone oxidoreductase chain 3 n=1 Tax=Phasianella solida TaxID=335754 RepID=A0A0S1F5Q7_9VEST|nr:NADH dehydrogenase subunit 3 [Phasianella solida]ALK03400.1 NADH dehydrogenase subunit 3 [Phasianella solida]
MLSYFVCSMIAVLISFVVLAVGWLLSDVSEADREKSSAFECGFDPMGSARIPFSMRFFLLAVIFLIFDVEIVLLFPPVSKLWSSGNMFLVLGFMAFLVILIVGTFHEWNEGSLDWFV